MEHIRDDGIAKSHPPGFLDEELTDDTKQETETAATEGSETPG